MSDDFVVLQSGLLPVDVATCKGSAEGAKILRDCGAATNAISGVRDMLCMALCSFIGLILAFVLGRAVGSSSFGSACR
jgi:hypothetical protein